MRVLAPTSLALLLLSGAAQAEVACDFGGGEQIAPAYEASFMYSSSGERGRETGKVSHFRLMTLGMSRDLELKTFDITTPGDYRLSTETLWRSVISEKGKRLKVSSGKFYFSHFEMHGFHGRASGTIEFLAEGVSGKCRFAVEIKGSDRDRLRVR